MTDKEVKQREDKKEYGEQLMTKEQKKKIISSLFGKLLKMHRNINILFAIVHFLIVIFSVFHIFIVGSVDNESTSCYITWPFSHIFYAFINYVYAWLFFYNFIEIRNPKNTQIIRISKRFLKILFSLVWVPVACKLISDHFCRNLTLSWLTIKGQVIHLIFEVIVVTIYFLWFEKKYSSFKMFYQEIIN